jgi:hypothetical protein
VWRYHFIKLLYTFLRDWSKFMATFAEVQEAVGKIQGDVANVRRRIGELTDLVLALQDQIANGFRKSWTP